MEAYAERRETTINAQLVGILLGDPPRVNLVTHASGRNGTKRHFTRQVSIPDSNLFVRLKQEASVGDSLRVTVVSEYREAGSITYLTDFKKASDVEQEPTVKNGTINIVPNAITPITIPLVRDSNAKVKH